ncbi:kinetochore-associated protein NSL1 homolog isoform X2 [Pseudoliparis swirei]|uniref:kinetochore-associated protein NSL1 homolog isoform X2 n=1 Tax=Pseudoliparis swirei TaxID=2059687 RepID=UPI0024BDE032|nr:kinetochore-associated protein NSL1 homolog isoform X2 [Pseudoliparis swirei]XP_056283526.1 kinetochore-associated protein NSL1 homolog isoform X2 [Pseudoliparis swirei]
MIPAGGTRAVSSPESSSCCCSPDRLSLSNGGGVFYTSRFKSNFEAAVQDNVLVAGLPWPEAPDAEAEDEALDLESLLDDAVVEAARRRRAYPNKIRPHVVHALRAERKLMVGSGPRGLRAQRRVTEERSTEIITYLINTTLSRFPGFVRAGGETSTGGPRRRAREPHERLVGSSSRDGEAGHPGHQVDQHAAETGRGAPRDPLHGAESRHAGRPPGGVRSRRPIGRAAAEEPAANRGSRGGGGGRGVLRGPPEENGGRGGVKKAE